MNNFWKNFDIGVDEMTETPNVFDLNEAFGKALLQQFFEPIPTGRDAITGKMFYAPSGICLMAQEIFKNYQRRIMDEVWEKLDLGVLAEKVSELVVAELVRKPTVYGERNIHQEELARRIKEIVAQQLGQRVVDQMDLQISPKAIESNEE